MSELDLGEGGDRHLARLETIAREALGEDGYRVVPSPAAIDLWQRVVRAGDGIFDPDLGERRPEAYAAARRAFYEALAVEHGCELVLEMRLVVVSVFWEDGRASWDGAEDLVSSSLVGSSLSGLHVSGRVPALSLWLWLHGSERDGLYFGAGGVEVLSRFDSETFVPDRPEQVLQSDWRLERAVRIALEEIPSRPPGAPPARAETPATR